jgi:predicted ATPase/class 3 adenylate cyclase
VTFLFTDIEGSTRLVQDLGDRYESALADHRQLLRTAFGERDGHEVGTEGDSFFVVFAKASDAVAAALDGQLALASHGWAEKPIRVRMGLHTGEAQLDNEGYIGLAVHQAARVSAAAHGGQVLVSQTTRDLVAGSLPDGANLVDLGEHRLKDLAHATRLYNLSHAGLQAELPPPRSLSVLPNNLPLQLTTFVGRDEEIAKITKLLGTTRLLTLAGAGGVGKTRLALQVAADVVTEYRDGAWLADLAPITDPELIVRGIAESLGAREEKGRTIDEVLVEHLQGKELLVVIDNCEHLAEQSADVIDKLLHAASGLTIVTTSREPLGAEGENVFRVPSLDTPSGDEPPEALNAYESVRLFCDRAMQATADFSVTTANAQAVTEICRRLDGMPLGIELAAARVRMLTPQEIASRLDQRFKLLTGGVRTGIRRQQTLRATVDWSYEMLSEGERLLFRRLAVFVGGFVLDAVESVCSGDGIDTSEVFDLLSNLVDRSLVVAEPREGKTRYRLLETMREYGREALVASGEAATTWSRHLEWCTGFAEAGEPALEGHGQAEILARFADELDNIRQALGWATTEGGAVTGMRLASALGRFWILRGLHKEGTRWLEACYAEAQADLTSGQKAKALLFIAATLGGADEISRCREIYAECAALPRDSSTLTWVGEALNDLGIISWALDADFDLATRQLEEALELRTSAGHRFGVAETLGNLSQVAEWRGDQARAAELQAQALAIYEEIGDAGRVAMVRGALATRAADQGDLKRARTLHEEGLATTRDLGAPALIAEHLAPLAMIAKDEGRFAEAEAMLDEAYEIARDLESAWGIGMSRRAQGWLAMDRGELNEAEQLVTVFLESVRAFGVPMYEALGIGDLSKIAALRGDAAEARSLHEEAFALLESMEHRRQAGLLRTNSGRIARLEGDPARARSLITEGLELSRESARYVEVAIAKHELGLVALDQGELDEAIGHFREAVRDRVSFGMVPATTASVEGIMMVEAARGNGERAATLAGAAAAERRRIGAKLPPAILVLIESAVARAREAIGDEEFAAAWARGERLSLDETLALAL